jgi:hypothetical protein
VVSRLIGAVVRGLLVALMIATPALVLPAARPDTAEIVALVALFAAALTVIEYASSYPSLVEFRDAPPFNRIRFGALLLTLFLISVLVRGEAEPGAFAEVVHAVGALIGSIIDFPYGPVRLMVLMLPPGAGAAELDLVRSAAGLAYLIALLSLAVFVLATGTGSWPIGPAGFNLWVNLPTFDPTAGGDVTDRLYRDARINVALGFVLPFLIPAAVRAGSELFAPVGFGSPHTLVWTMAAWAFLPASLMMRGIAMGRVARLIEARRRRGLHDGVGLLAV